MGGWRTTDRHKPKQAASRGVCLGSSLQSLLRMGLIPKGFPNAGAGASSKPLLQSQCQAGVVQVTPALNHTSTEAH